VAKKSIFPSLEKSSVLSDEKKSSPTFNKVSDKHSQKRFGFAYTETKKTQFEKMIIIIKKIITIHIKYVRFK
jgi:hypothetical protein